MSLIENHPGSTVQASSKTHLLHYKGSKKYFLE